MVKLATLKPRLGVMQPRMKVARQVEGQTRSQLRDASVHWRRWYKTKRWQDLRWSVLERDLFTCRMCKRVEAVTSRLVADHKRPHHGDEAMFWDERNLQCLCKACHDGRKQAEERAGYHG